MGAIESRIAPDKTEKPAKHQRIVDNGVCVPAEFSRSRSVGDIDFPTELRLAPINMRLKSKESVLKKGRGASLSSQTMVGVKGTHFYARIGASSPAM